MYATIPYPTQPYRIFSLAAVHGKKLIHQLLHRVLFRRLHYECFIFLSSSPPVISAAIHSYDAQSNVCLSYMLLPTPPYTLPLILVGPNWNPSVQPCSIRLHSPYPTIIIRLSTVPYPAQPITTNPLTISFLLQTIRLSTNRSYYDQQEDVSFCSGWKQKSCFLIFLLHLFPRIILISRVRLLARSLTAARTKSASPLVQLLNIESIRTSRRQL